MFKRPMTAAEREIDHKRCAWILAMNMGRIVFQDGGFELRGVSKMPCPGENAFHDPCYAPDAWTGRYGCSANHVYFHTNHKRLR